MPAEALRALEAEATAPSDGQVFTLATDVATAELFVPHPKRWRASARRALMDPEIIDGDVRWAESVLSPEDFAAWMTCDPTTDEAGEFIKQVFLGNGEDLGKSEPSTSSSRSTRSR